MFCQNETTFNLRDPTGTSFPVALNTNADCILSNRRSPLTVSVLCAAISVGTLHLTLEHLHRIPNSAL